MTFLYSSLKPNDIRLLRPVPSASGHLYFELAHFSLSSKPRYAALSYTWGPPGDNYQIYINGNVFFIRSNLYNALRQLSDSDRIEKYLWADAICINQGTSQDALDERSIQVILMRQIYEQAARVFVWLGKPENEANNRLAFDRLRYFWKLHMRGFMKAHPYRPWWWPKKPRNEGTDTLDAIRALQPAKDKKIFDSPGSSTHKAWLGIVAVWRNEWWTRTWVFQEATIPENYKLWLISGVFVFAKSTKVKFLCGDQITTWNALVASSIVAGSILLTPGLDAPYLKGCLERFDQIYEFRRNRIQNNVIQEYLLPLLQKFRDTKCSDLRDKVYAPLGLAPDDVRRHIKPDYGNKTVIDVYQAVVEYCLAQPDANLDFLGYVRSCKSDQNQQAGLLNLPSWIPDFSSSLGSVPMPKLLYVPKRQHRKVGLYNDGFPMQNEPTMPTYQPLGQTLSRSFVNGRQLHVSGVQVDRVRDFVPYTGQDLATVQTLAKQKATQWASEFGHRYPSSGDWTNAVDRTMVLDLTYDTMRRPSERGGSQDRTFLQKGRDELSQKEFRAQASMLLAQHYAFLSRNLGYSETQYLLMVPNAAVVGDTIWALSGGQVLYILRLENPYRKEYTFVGECYAHGLMDGEILGMIQAGNVRMEDISLI